MFVELLSNWWIAKRVWGAENKLAGASASLEDENGQWHVLVADSTEG